MTAADLPLAGITVVTLESAVAATLATRHLADLGARVIKIEQVGEGDFARSYDHVVHGLASHFVWLNRGKESVTLDLKADESSELVSELVARADVFIQNAAPGAAQRLGLEGEELLARHPRLVVAGISGYGMGGRLRDRKAYDMLIQAEWGLMSVTGTPETATKAGIRTADIAAGLYTRQAVLAVLFRRERTGRGGVVDISMFDATVEWLRHPMYMQPYAGQQVPRMGLSHAAIAPCDTFPTADGQILVGVQNDRPWRTLMIEVFGRPRPGRPPSLGHQHTEGGSPRGVRPSGRRADTAIHRRRARCPLGCGRPAGRPDQRHGRTGRASPAVGPRLLPQVDTPTGPIDAVLPSMTFRDVELPMGPVPALGAHTDVVLAELGIDAATIDHLVAAGVAGRPTDVPVLTA